jgi:hypothetical protein
MDFALYRSGACYNHPSFMIYTYTGVGGGRGVSYVVKDIEKIHQYSTEKICEM